VLRSLVFTLAVAAACGNASAGDNGLLAAPPKARTAYRSASRTTAAERYPTTRWVTVEGVGNTADEALKDAFRAAVQVVMGTLVEAETRVENDTVLEQVLTFSDGYIETWEPVSDYKKDGLVRRRIAALVRRDDLMLATGRSSSVLDARGLYAEALSKLDRRKNAVAFLNKTLSLLPKGVLRVELAGAHPPIIAQDDTTTTICPDLAIRADAQKYAAVADRLVNVLSCLSKYHGTLQIKSAALPEGARDERNQAFQSHFVQNGPSVSDAMPILAISVSGTRALQLIDYNGLPKNIPALSERKRAGATLFVIKSGGVWKWIEIEEHVPFVPHVLSITVRCRSEGGAEVRRGRLRIGPTLPTIAVSDSNDALRMFLISPGFLFIPTGDKPVVYTSDSLVASTKMTLTNEELARIVDIEVGVQNDE
jgi:hypothetical protein